MAPVSSCLSEIHFFIGHVSDPSILDAKVAFKGIRYQILRTGLPDSAFAFIGAQKSLDVEFDIAELHDVSAGGKYTLQAQGALPYVEEVNSNKLSNKALSYSSNALDVDVDGVEASNVRLAIDKLKVRTALSTDCSGSQKSATSKVLTNCASLASAAAKAAESGDANK